MTLFQSFSLEHGILSHQTSNLIASLPRSLRNLSLNGSTYINLSQVPGALNSPFRSIHKTLPNLEKVNVTKTDHWIHNSDTKWLLTTPKSNFQLVTTLGVVRPKPFFGRSRRLRNL